MQIFTHPPFISFFTSFFNHPKGRGIYPKGINQIAPRLFANTITVILNSAIVAFYSWRMALALFVTLPIAFGLIFLTRKLQSTLGERHVRANSMWPGRYRSILKVSKW
jgi:ABC-type multidrug transport system fused ATPase/permease subunit